MTHVHSLRISVVHRPLVNNHTARWKLLDSLFFGTFSRDEDGGKRVEARRRFTFHSGGSALYQRPRWTLLVQYFEFELLVYEPDLLCGLSRDCDVVGIITPSSFSRLDAVNFILLIDARCIRCGPPQNIGCCCRSVPIASEKLRCAFEDDPLRICMPILSGFKR